MTSSYQRDWIEEDRRRSRQMDELFLLDHRDDPKHEKAGLYSGLYEEILIFQKWAARDGWHKL